jgi:hypothetical protein
MSNARLKLGIFWFEKTFMTVTRRNDSVFAVRNGGRKKAGVMCPLVPPFFKESFFYRITLPDGALH